jgi:hypothetical protein
MNCLRTISWDKQEFEEKFDWKKKYSKHAAKKERKNYWIENFFCPFCLKTQTYQKVEWKKLLKGAKNYVQTSKLISNVELPIQN